MKPVVGVVSYPGSNCEHDVVHALQAMGAEAFVLWHQARELGALSGVVIPGGFAHGDYLRPGAIARFSPVTDAIVGFADAGGPVLGICNGFQILTEAGLLPGALRQNAGLRFLCEDVRCQVASAQSMITAHLAVGTEFVLPINHYEGSYTCGTETLDRLVDNGQVVLTYRENPNGSEGSVAGVANRAGNVVGLMPHPERAVELMLGSEDGRTLLEGFLAAAASPVLARA